MCFGSAFVKETLLSSHRHFFPCFAVIWQARFKCMLNSSYKTRLRLKIFIPGDLTWLQLRNGFVLDGNRECMAWKTHRFSQEESHPSHSRLFRKYFDQMSCVNVMVHSSSRGISLIRKVARLLIPTVASSQKKIVHPDMQAMNSKKKTSVLLRCIWIITVLAISIVIAFKRLQIRFHAFFFKS